MCRGAAGPRHTAGRCLQPPLHAAPVPKQAGTARTCAAGAKTSITEKKAEHKDSEPRYPAADTQWLPVCARIARLPWHRPHSPTQVKGLPPLCSSRCPSYFLSTDSVNPSRLPSHTPLRLASFKLHSSAIGALQPLSSTAPQPSYLHQQQAEALLPCMLEARQQDKRRTTPKQHHMIVSVVRERVVVGSKVQGISHRTS